MAITLKAARVNAGLTQKEASELIGVSQYTLANWESGKTAPSVFNLRNIEAAYGVVYSDILFLQKNYG